MGGWMREDNRDEKFLELPLLITFYLFHIEWLNLKTI
jgi:hypothetical protein